MLVALADTHAETEPALTPHLRTRLDESDGLLHAGDFTRPAVVEAFASRTESFWGVSGNSDTAGVRDRLPATQVVDRLGCRFLLVHGHRHDRTSLGLLARQEDADITVVGHTHDPGIETVGGVTVVNPGSHADPRGRRPAYATIDRVDDGIQVWLRSVDGAALGSTRVE